MDRGACQMTRASPRQIQKSLQESEGTEPVSSCYRCVFLLLLFAVLAVKVPGKRYETFTAGLTSHMTLSSS